MSESKNHSNGLSTEEAKKLLEQYGPNEITEERPNLLLFFLKKFWGPIPWMLEVKLILEIVFGKVVNAVIIGFLLTFNAVLGFFHEQKAQGAVELLKKKLQVTARVLRDGNWVMMPARELVPGDYVRLRMGDFAPADLEIVEGHVDVDQSALTGESLPVEKGEKDTIYSGSIIRRGEISGNVTATGAKSYFGKTTELVKLAKVPSQAEMLIMSIIKYLLAIDIVLVVAIFIYAIAVGISMEAMIPFALILLIASVPVALPPTFTLSNAIGSLALSKEGVLTTRLSAIQDSAAMEILCSDKTGTLTLNELTLSTIRPHGNFTEQDLLKTASMASEAATMDAIDKVIIDKAKELNIDIPQKTKFIPFDPATKRSEGFFETGGKKYVAIKGSPLIIKQFDPSVDWEKESEEFASRGERTIAVLGGEEGTTPKFYGLLALSDPVRPDSNEVISKLKGLGVNVKMLTGDNTSTALHIAEKLGITGNVCDYNGLKKDGKVELKPDVLNCEVYAGIFPEDKYNLVQALQKGGKEVIGMTGDGVNDAPALKQAQVGIAVSSATDVAKAAASLVLTNPGLSGVEIAVETGRRVYQRLFSYISNKIVKTVQIGLFLALGLLIFGKNFDIKSLPLIILLLIFTNDFVTMSLSTDNVRYSAKPNKWNVRELMEISLAFSLGWLIYIFGVYIAGWKLLNLPIHELDTVIFLGLVYSGHANIFLVREKSYLWHSMPSTPLLIAEFGGILLATLMAVYGWLIAPISLSIILYLVIFTLIYMVLLDLVKVPILKKFA
ncbi:MAG: plasma-membrane proton-efflux P-type ATPase [bacterium]